jgi:hypothetical protein
MNQTNIVAGTFRLILIPASIVFWILGFTYQSCKNAFANGRIDAE